MPQSTLAVSYDDLRREVGLFLGWGRDPSTWTSDQGTDFTYVLKDGLARFYWPTDEDGKAMDHEWSFLTTTSKMTTIDGQFEYDMPDDFGDIVGPVFYAAASFTVEIEVIDAWQMRRMQQNATGEGKPVYVAFEAQRMSGLEQQRWKMMLHPTPGDGYEIVYRYNILPDALVDATREYPYGGAMYRETIVEAVLSAAELKFMDGTSGEHTLAFRRALAAAIGRDSRANKGEKLGYNGDRSEERFTIRRTRYLNPVTYNGLTSE